MATDNKAIIMEDAVRKVMEEIYIMQGVIIKLMNKSINNKEEIIELMKNEINEYSHNKFGFGKDLPDRMARFVEGEGNCLYDIIKPKLN